MTKIDEAFHCIFNNLREIRWRDFPVNNIMDDSDFYQYYYAEDRLYVIKNIVTDDMIFEYAKSPLDALRSFQDDREDEFRVWSLGNKGDEE